MGGLCPGNGAQSMKTVKLNVFEEQRKWIKEHSKSSDCLFVCDENGEPIQAIYKSPLERWKGMIAPDGTVNVPDMDYYNSCKDMNEMLAVIDELFPKAEDED